MVRKLLAGLMLMAVCAGNAVAGMPTLNEPSSPPPASFMRIEALPPPPSFKCVNIGTGVQECTYCRAQESLNQTVCWTEIKSHVPSGGNWDP